jgi:hypothetical protein
MLFKTHLSSSEASKKIDLERLETFARSSRTEFLHSQSQAQQRFLRREILMALGHLSMMSLDHAT